jgi:hypothetical protein
MAEKDVVEEKKENLTVIFQKLPFGDLKKGEIDPQVAKKIQQWIDGGSEVAVYRNVDMSSPEIGRLAFLKVGKGAILNVAPERMPDNPVIPIAWRYSLQRVIRSKEQLKEVL